MSSPSDPAAVPLPPGDDTAYFNTPRSSVFAATPNTRNHQQMYGSDDESTPQTTRTLPPFTHPHLAGVYSNMNTPTPVNMPGPQDLETPRGRPQRRGGKYHPGQASALRRDANLDLSTRQLSQSSGPDSGSDEEVDDEEIKSVSEEEDFGHAEYEDLDKTIAVNFSNQASVPLNMSTPLQRQFPGLHYSAKTQTPARKLLANSKDFFGETPVTSQKNAATFMNPDILPSAFSEDAIHNLPYLSSATPHKLNTIQGLPSNISPYQLTVENSQLSTQLREKDAKIRYLEEMLSGQIQTDFDDFFDFSPEKRIKPTLPNEDVPLTIKKRRRSPTKEMPTTARKTRTGSRTGSRSPVKAFHSLFESISTPIKLTAQERKEERRRRETQEFRQFSTIDLEALKGYLPAVAHEEKIGDIESANTTEKPKNPAKSPTKRAKSPVKNSVKHITADEVEHTGPIIGGASKPEIIIPPSPARRIRHHRSNSAPPMPKPLDKKVRNVSPIKNNLPSSNSIATLQARVTQLEEDLENTTINLQKAVAALNGERRARIAAEETWHFLEMERKFGVCCQSAQAAEKATTEAAATAAAAAAAAVPVPSSPTESVQSVATTYSERNLGSSRYGARPASRMDRERSESRMGSERPTSRMGSERPVSRMDRERALGYSNSTSKIGHISTVPPPQTAGKKRPRDESADPGMRKAPIPRQAEKRVLSGAVGAANVPLGGGINHNSSGGILKKPTLGTGVSAPPMKAPVRAHGAAAGTRSAMGLARGARR